FGTDRALARRSRTARDRLDARRTDTRQRNSMKHRLLLAASLSALLALTTLVAPIVRSGPLSAQLDAATVSLTRGPYLQMGTPSSVVVRWRSSGATDSFVQYGPDPASLTASVSLP